MADERVSLAPAGMYGRSDEVMGLKIYKKSEEEPGKCLVYVLTAINIAFGVCLILALILVRIRTPKIVLRSVSARDLRLGNTSNPYLNATLVHEISIENPNFGAFVFGNSTMTVAYGNIGVVGHVKIAGGRVEARKTARLNRVQVEISSKGIANSTKLSSDLGLGFLELVSVAAIKGRVDVIRMSRSKSGEMSCTMKLNLTGRSIQDLSCE